MNKETLCGLRKTIILEKASSSLWFLKVMDYGWQELG